MAKKKLVCPEGVFCFDSSEAEKWFASTSNRHFESYSAVFFDPTGVDKTQVRFALSLAIRALKARYSDNPRLPATQPGTLYIPKEFAKDELLAENFVVKEELGDVVLLEHK